MESPPLVDSAPASLMLQKVTDYAFHLQSSNPRWTTSEILVTIRSSIEQGTFGGDLRTLLLPPSPSPPQRLSSIAVKPLPVEYQPYVTHTPYARHATPPSQPSAGTVNPATLQLTVEHNPHFSYTEALNTRDESPHANFDSETTHDAEFETVAPYTYVSRPSMTSTDIIGYARFICILSVNDEVSR
jgi:hypothetical protein